MDRAPQWATPADRHRGRPISRFRSKFPTGSQTERRTTADDQACQRRAAAGHRERRAIESRW